MTAGSTYTTTRDRYLDDTKIVDGIRYTTKEDQNSLSNDDFLELMLEEMKQQDPTKPMDSAALMDSQLQMSTIQANQDMSKSMTALQASYANSALATATNIIGHLAENGDIRPDGMLKSYKIETVENIDGKLFANGRELLGELNGENQYSKDLVAIPFDSIKKVR